MKGKIVLVGLGGLAKVALQIMASKPEIREIVVASRDVQNGEAFCNLVGAGAIAQGMHTPIRFLPLDLNDIERTAESLSREKPELIFSTATLMSPWLTGKLPLEINMTLYPAGFGVWLPMHLPLTMKLMKALRLADYQGVTLTAPFPDIVNCMLSRVNLAPTSGIGNVDLYIPKVRRLSAEALGLPVSEVDVQMVAHHALMPHFMGLSPDSAPPYHLSVMTGGEEVAEQIDARRLLASSLPVVVGPETNYLTASSAVRLIQAFLSEKEARLHAPAPSGLPGGYPVAVSKEGIAPAPIRGLSLEEAVRINEASHPFDSIQSIEPDGTAVFTEAAAEALRTAFGFQCDRLHPDDADARSEELLAKVREHMQSG